MVFGDKEIYPESTERRKLKKIKNNRKEDKIMSKYCMSCGAANANTANVCTRCGRNLEETLKGPIPRDDPERQVKQGSGLLPLKYQIGSIAMFVCAGITIVQMIIWLANKDEYVFELFMQSRDTTLAYLSLDQIRAIYTGVVIGACLIGVGIHLRCGFLLRKTQLHGKGVPISYSILFGVSTLNILLGFVNADIITTADIFSLGWSAGACVLMIMKRYDWKMEKRNIDY